MNRKVKHPFLFAAGLLVLTVSTALAASQYFISRDLKKSAEEEAEEEENTPETE